MIGSDCQYLLSVIVEFELRYIGGYRDQIMEA